jgi:hypothetical protein
MLYRGALQVLHVEHWAAASVEFAMRLDHDGDEAMGPWWFRTTTINAPTFKGTYWDCPLWIPLVLLLAWPVTSLLLTRRRRKGRGFAVEANAAGSTPLPPGEVAAQVAAATGADGEGGHQHATG